MHVAGYLQAGCNLASAAAQCETSWAWPRSGTHSVGAPQTVAAIIIKNVSKYVLAIGSFRKLQAQLCPTLAAGATVMATLTLRNNTASIPSNSTTR